MRAVELRDQLTATIGSQFGLPADIVLLSDREETQINFAAAERATMLWEADQGTAAPRDSTVPGAG